MSKEPRRILVFRIGHLGDTLVALPAFWSIRDHFPDAQLTLLSNTNAENPHYVTARNILPAEGLFDSWLSYPNSVSKVRAAVAFAALATRIRAKHFDMLIYLMPRVRSARQIDRDKRFFRWLGIAKLLGFEFARANLLAARPPVPSPLVKSEGEFLLDSLRSMQIPISEHAERSGLLFSHGEVAKATEFANSSYGKYDRTRPLIAVGPGSKWPNKTWSEDRLSEVISQLIVSRGVIPLVFGSSDDIEVAMRLISGWGTGANAAGMLSVREAAAVMQHCSLYLGNDTGTMHLAAAVGAPCVGLFAANNWAGQWYPLGEGHRLFRPQVECAGCLNLADAESHPCLDLITVDEVFDACTAILTGASSSVKHASLVG